MISFLIGFMIMPALVGIVLVITWAVEYFAYLARLLKAHYNAKYQRKQAKKDKEIPVITLEEAEAKEVTETEEKAEDVTNNNEAC